MPDQLQLEQTQLDAADVRRLSLAKANLVRRERAAIKAQLGRRDLFLDDVLERFEPWPCVARAPILEIVSAARGFGKSKARRALKRVGIPPHRKVEDVSHRQRKELLRYLMAEHGQAFYGSAAVGSYLC